MYFQGWYFIILANAFLTGYVLVTATPVILPTDAASAEPVEFEHETASDVSYIASPYDSDAVSDTDLTPRNAPGHFVCQTPEWESECFERYHHLCERGTFANLGVQQRICDHDQCSCVGN